MVPLGPWNPRPKLSNSRVNTALGVNRPVPFGPSFRYFELAPGSSRDMRFRTHNLWSGAERGLELTVGLMSTAPRGGNHRVFRAANWQGVAQHVLPSQERSAAVRMDAVFGWPSARRLARTSGV